MYHRNPIINVLIWLFTGFGYWGKKYEDSRNLLTYTQNQIVESVSEQERLKLKIEQLKTEMNVQKQNQELELNRLRSTFKLEQETERSRFNLEREQAKSKDTFTLQQTLEKEKWAVEQKAQQAQLKLDETLVLKKLEFEQKVKQAELDRERSILTVKEEFARKEADLHQKLHAEMYEKLNKALLSMSAEGDKNTKFVHELMLKIFDKAPNPGSFEFTQRQYTGIEGKAPTQVEIS